MLCAKRTCKGAFREAGEDVIALNLDRIGHTYPAYRYEVSRGKVREYAVATDVNDSRYTADDGEAAWQGLPAPPTFAACFTITRGGAALHDDEGLGAHWNLVHGAQEYEFHRPVRVGDVLDCTPRIVDITPRGRMELLVLEVLCRDAATSEPVVTSRETIIFFNRESA